METTVRSMQGNIDQGQNVTVLVSTCANGRGGMFWMATICHVDRDELGRVAVYETLADVVSHPACYASHEEALSAGMARFDGTEEVEGDYPGGVLPTGWDAAYHKALYE